MDFHADYYKNPYQECFDADVVSVSQSADGYVIELNRTCFYPEGGGQPGDTGYLEYTDPIDGTEHRIHIIDTRLVNDLIKHIAKEMLPEGISVSGRIDFSRRFGFMQAHTAEHIFSGLAHRTYGCENVGFHMSDVITVDFDRSLTEEQISQIEAETNAVIMQNLPIITLLPKPEELDTLEYRSKKELEGDVRVIQIPNADSCACCGLHVRATGEIGLLKVLSSINYKNGVRITLIAGGKALEDYVQKHAAILSISRALSVKPEEAEQAFLQLQAQLHEKDQRIAAANARYFEAAAALFPIGKPYILCIENGLNPIELRRFCELIVEKANPDIAIVLKESGTEQTQYHFCIGSKKICLKEWLPTLFAHFPGKGGGKNDFVQGSLQGNIEELRAFFEET